MVRQFSGVSVLHKVGKVDIIVLLLPANEVCEGYVFTPVCQSFCSQGWPCMAEGCVAGGMHGEGHAWLGGMCGRGACMAGGCMVGGA